MTWVGKVRPGPLSKEYTIKVVYRLRARPRVYVLSPTLMSDEEGELPHVYRERTGRTNLCLYFPKFQQWTPSMAIADTIVPWASLWLLYYEHWRATGTWLGGGVHPQRRKREKRRRFGSRRRRASRASPSAEAVASVDNIPEEFRPSSGPPSTS